MFEPGPKIYQSLIICTYYFGGIIDIYALFHALYSNMKLTVFYFTRHHFYVCVD